jgi:hypothetical protein
MSAAERDYSHRSRLEKLGVRSGSTVWISGLDDAEFEAELRAAGAQLDAQPPFDLVFVRVSQVSELDQLAQLSRLIQPAGAVWVVRPKGNSRSVRETDIIHAAKRFGLVDNKIASFSDSLSAMRLVIPIAARTEYGGA